MISRRLATFTKVGAVTLLLGALSFSSTASAVPSAVALSLPEKVQRMLSQGALARWYAQHPEQVSAGMRARPDWIAALGARVNAVPRALAPGDFPMRRALFNRDDLGLPQNEESVDRCSSNGNLVLAGTNDYRGLLNPLGNFTGWHFSDNGATLTREGLLPAVTFADGVAVPSSGDPVVAFDAACNAYMATLNLVFVDGVPTHSGIGVYRTTAGTLGSCPGGDDPTCWPTRTLADQVISPDPAHFHLLDKPWMAVGHSAGQTVIWVTYTDFAVDFPNVTTTIKAVRCEANLTSCGKPINLSAGGSDVQFSDVTVGPDGRTYVTWVEDRITPNDGETFVIKLRVAEAGSSEFSPEGVVTTELEPIGFGGVLHANDFRVATYPKHDVKIVNGIPRIFVIWESCQSRPLNVICEFSRMRMTFSDSFGAGWSNPTTLSAGGDNYFGTLSANPGGANLAVAYWTSRFDPVFGNRQDLELVTVGPQGTVVNRQRLTTPSNEPEADPFLRGFFIGDYIEVTARADNALVAFNANYRKQALGLDASLPTAQQDNYLAQAPL
ncbi:hypothetical protein [Kibdelosporangium aridum]|uniref:Uncharacterized protein n=1 Tax=Kibdelosporangium aridum TaxID=2030 RepID=A0A1W2FZ53_KIBAR|nr:hypothetical protein [Kibdelosporangium aridum]SMD27249.1 hypothetical protein SAMN05661093_10852 [Kibdelosporangium aridum]SMD27456.1 hypothetical protein SAMN05661093_11063 [Kibdelosporangium aridum]SMD27621.1 hypothetical protein SAMN05661093_11231 [Kibdelosporangium aridum]SMD27656.1 hypothetical protein SAMN05661093_11266 [Kibdelosporangium aridum]